jgi:hypothetical protein
MNEDQAKALRILFAAVAEYLKKDQAADYSLPEDVSVSIRSKRVADLPTREFTTADGTLTVALDADDPLGIRLTAHKFPRAGLWNGPDVLRNNSLRRMLASLFHDLIWEHADELAEAWQTDKTEVLRWGNDVLYLVWAWASEDSWLGRREAWLSFQATNFAAPWYHRVKEALACLAAASLLSGCYTLPDGAVVEVTGAEVVERVMAEQGDGLSEPARPGEDGQEEVEP